jgi:predicted kinase
VNGRALAHDDTACEVILMSGLPASGKDTYLRTHAPDLPVISLDALRDQLDADFGDAEVIAEARERARGYLRAGTSFAWNATNLTPSLRGQLIELFRSYRARTRIVYCEASPADQHARNRSRTDPVPAAVIDRMLGLQIARYVFGTDAEFRRQLDIDPVVQRAYQLLTKASSQKEAIEAAK